MSQKSSLPQSAKSVSEVLTPDILLVIALISSEKAAAKKIIYAFNNLRIVFILSNITWLSCFALSSFLGLSGINKASP